MAEEQAPEPQASTLDQQIDPNADLMKARPGGAEDIGANPGAGDPDEKADSTYEGAGSEGGYEGGPEKTDIPGT